MPCYHPLSAYQAPSGGPLIWNHPYTNIQVPCGKCIGCRLERSRQWAMRAEQEASLHEHNCFVTLTYSDDNLPHFSSLQPVDLRNFFKRLRKFIAPVRFRYLASGEYGTTCKRCNQSRSLCRCDVFSEGLGRPHYHVCFFGFDPADRVACSTRNGHIYYQSELISKAWGLGNVIVADFSFETAAYTARYVCKKINGDLADEHYSCVDEYGELHHRVPEFIRVSRRPGLGAGWLHKYRSDLDKDFVVIRGRKMRPPKFYDRKIAEADVFDAVLIKDARKRHAESIKHDNTTERLAVKEELQLSRANLLRRGYENDI